MIELKAAIRDPKASVRELRSNRVIPGVVYGHGVEARSISVPLHDFVKAYKKAGESTLVDLVVGNDAAVKVLVHDIERNIESNEPQHVDFYQVNMKEKIHAEIPIILENEAPAVKAQGGTLIKQIESVPVKCFPGDLVDAFRVDISVLDDFTKRVHISDISNIPESMELLRPTDSVVALVIEPRVAEVESTPEEVVAAEGAAAGTEEEGKEGAAEGAGAAEAKA